MIGRFTKIGRQSTKKISLQLQNYFSKMQTENETNTPIRYTDSRILIANWNEEKFTKEEKFRKFLLKRDRGNLVSQKTAQVFAFFLKEVQLEVPCDFVRFGAIIQLNAPEMPSDERICSTPKIDSTLGSATYCPYKYFKNGEINQSVGLAVRKVDLETAIKPTHFRWKCFNVNPSIRFETEGEPVPSNTKLVICHSATHKLLAGEKTLFKGIFGMVHDIFNFVSEYLNEIDDFYTKRQFTGIWVICYYLPNCSKDRDFSKYLDNKNDVCWRGLKFKNVKFSKHFALKKQNNLNGFILNYNYCPSSSTHSEQ